MPTPSSDAAACPSPLALLRWRPGLRRLWLAESISALGDWLAYVAISVVVLRHGTGLLALAVVLVVHAAPQALVAPIAGPLADRFDRRRLVVGAHLVQAALAAATAIAAAELAVGWVQALVLLRASVGAVAEVAKEASIPRLVAPGELRAAHALLSSTWSVLFAVGVALGGAICSAQGPVAAIALDALSFAIAAFCFLGLPALGPEPAPTSPNPAEPSTRPATALRAALTAEPQLWEATLTKVPLAVASGGAWVLASAAADRAGGVEGGALLLGLLHGARALGTGLGPWVLPRLRRGRPWPSRWRAGTLVGAAGVACLTFGADPACLLFGACVWGLGQGDLWVLAVTHRQAHAPDELQGRLAALDAWSFRLAESAMALLAAAIADALALPTAAGVVGLLGGLLAWASAQAWLGPSLWGEDGAVSLRRRAQLGSGA